MLNWNDLKVLLAVAETGSLTKAARLLGQNHTTVFRRLNALETHLNIRLFDRLKSGYKLTPIGERTLVLARNAETSILDIERQLAGQDMRPSGTVRITTAPNIAQTIIPITLAELRQTHPEIRIEIAAGDHDYDLTRREADIALRATTNPPEHLIGKQVASVNWWLCGPLLADNPHQINKISDLDKLPLISADRTFRKIAVFQWLDKHYSQNIVTRASSLSIMASLIKAGVGYGLIPSDQIDPDLQRFFSLNNFPGQLWLLTHPDLRGSQRIRVVWDAIEKTIKQLL